MKLLRNLILKGARSYISKQSTAQQVIYLSIINDVVIWKLWQVKEKGQ